MAEIPKHIANTNVFLDTLDRDASTSETKLFMAEMQERLFEVLKKYNASESIVRSYLDIEVQSKTTDFWSKFSRHMATFARDSYYHYPNSWRFNVDEQLVVKKIKAFIAKNPDLFKEIHVDDTMRNIMDKSLTRFQLRDALQAEGTFSEDELKFISVYNDIPRRNRMLSWKNTIDMEMNMEAKMFGSIPRTSQEKQQKIENVRNFLGAAKAIITQSQKKISHAAQKDVEKEVQVHTNNYIKALYDFEFPRNYFETYEGKDVHTIHYGKDHQEGIHNLDYLTDGKLFEYFLAYMLKKSLFNEDPEAIILGSKFCDSKGVDFYVKKGANKYLAVDLGSGLYSFYHNKKSKNKVPDCSNFIKYLTVSNKDIQVKIEPVIMYIEPKLWEGFIWDLTDAIKTGLLENVTAAEERHIVLEIFSNALTRFKDALKTSEQDADPETIEFLKTIQRTYEYIHTPEAYFKKLLSAPEHFLPDKDHAALMKKVFIPRIQNKYK